MRRTLALLALGSLAAATALQAGIAPSPFTARLEVAPRQFVPPGGQLHFTAYLVNAQVEGATGQKVPVVVRGEGWSSDVREVICPKPGGTVAVRFATAFAVPANARVGAKLTFQLLDPTSRLRPAQPLCAPVMVVVRSTAVVRPDVVGLPDLRCTMAVFRDRACQQPVTGDVTSTGAVNLYAQPTVTNHGTGAAGPFRTLVQIVDPGQAPAAWWPELPGLAARAHVDFPVVEYVVKNPANQVEFRVAADQMCKVAESCETNNRAVQIVNVTISK